MATRDSTAQPPRILIVRPSALGDVCRSVPVLTSLRRAFSDARIDWLVQDSFLPAIAAHPDLTTAIPFPRHSFQRVFLPKHARKVRKFLSALRAARYDLVLDCQGLARSGFIARATGAPERFGYADAGEFGWLGVNRRVEAPELMHTVDRMLALAEAAGAPPLANMRLYTTPDDRAFVTTPGKTIPVDLVPGTFAVVAPTTRWPGKLWPMDRHAELVRRLLNDSSFAISRVVITGGPHERAQCAELLSLTSSNPRVIDLVGKSTIGQLMALIELSALVVGCDSAAIHMAVGFDRPLVALYGPTRVELVGPYGRSQHVLQHIGPSDTLDHKDEASGQTLMRRISVDEAFELAASQHRARSPDSHVNCAAR